MNDKAAAAVPFARAAGLLEDLAGVRLAVKRAGRAAEASGAAQAAGVRERSALIAGRKLVPMPPSPQPDKLYAVIDGTGVPMTANWTTAGAIIARGTGRRSRHAGAIIALRCREASSHWEGICSTPRTQTRTA